MAWRVHWMQAAAGDTEITYTAQEDRAVVLQSIFSREGVLDLLGGDLKVTQRAAGPNYTIDIAVGRAAIRGDDVSDQGTYVVSNTTPSTGWTVPTSGAVARTHQVIVRLKDKLHNALWPGYTGLPEVLADTSYAAALAIPSAIVLASITAPANAVSVTNAMITDRRIRAIVGTPAVEGTIPLTTPGYGALNPNRAPSYQVNPDGWVMFSGYFHRTAASSATTANVPFQLTDALPPEIRPANGDSRNLFGNTAFGGIDYFVDSANGFKMYGRYLDNHTLVQNNTWFSLDGVGYRI